MDRVHRHSSTMATTPTIIAAIMAGTSTGKRDARPRMCRDCDCGARSGSVTEEKAAVEVASATCRTGTPVASTASCSEYIIVN